MATGNKSMFDEDITTVPAEGECTSLVSCIECLPDATENLEEPDIETDSVGFCETLEQNYSLSISTRNNTIEDTTRSKMEQFFKTDQSISILFDGKPGAAKSSLINALIGRNIASEDASPHSITELLSLKQLYKGEYEKAEGAIVKVTVWDLPGLQDRHHRDQKYLHHPQQHEHHPDQKYLHHLQQPRHRSQSGRSGFGQTNFPIEHSLLLIDCHE